MRNGGDGAFFLGGKRGFLQHCRNGLELYLRNVIGHFEYFRAGFFACPATDADFLVYCEFHYLPLGWFVHCVSSFTQVRRIRSTARFALFSGCFAFGKLNLVEKRFEFLLNIYVVNYAGVASFERERRKVYNASDVRFH